MLGFAEILHVLKGVTLQPWGLPEMRSHNGQHRLTMA